MKRFALWLALLMALAGAGGAWAQPPVDGGPSPEELWKKARINGKYSMLLLQARVPDDEAAWGTFNDRGLHPAGAVGKDVYVPAGYRVYAAPYWFIWRDMISPKRPWGPEQLIGEPDTAELGDEQTAWASQTQDDSDEWLLLEYTAPVMAAGVKIYESYSPGAIKKITAFTLDGKEETIWEGKAAPVMAIAVVVNEKDFPRPLKTNRIKIYLDSKTVPGWNEIDAVGLRDKDGKVHWASNAACSSTYAEQGDVEFGFTQPPGGAVPNGDRVRLLEEAIRQLQNDVNELRQRAGLPPRPVLPNPDVEVLLGEGPLILNWPKEPRREGQRGPAPAVPDPAHAVAPPAAPPREQR